MLNVRPARQGDLEKIVVASAGNTRGLNFYHRADFFDWEMILEKEVK